MARAKKSVEKCARIGCRRVRREGEFCRKCAPKNEVIESNEIVHPIDAAKKLTPLELAQLKWLGAEVEKNLLQVRLHQYDVRELRIQAERQLQEALQSKEQERKARAEDLQHTRRQYDHLTLTLSKKYGVSDPKKMVVDTETGLIRDASEF